MTYLRGWIKPDGSFIGAGDSHGAELIRLGIAKPPANITDSDDRDDWARTWAHQHGFIYLSSDHAKQHGATVGYGPASKKDWVARWVSRNGSHLERYDVYRGGSAQMSVSPRNPVTRWPVRVDAHFKTIEGRAAFIEQIPRLFGETAKTEAGDFAGHVIVLVATPKGRKGSEAVSLLQGLAQKSGGKVLKATNSAIANANAKPLRQLAPYLTRTKLGGKQGGRDLIECTVIDKRSDEFRSLAHDHNVEMELVKRSPSGDTIKLIGSRDSILALLKDAHMTKKPAGWRVLDKRMAMGFSMDTAQHDSQMKLKFSNADGARRFASAVAAKVPGANIRLSDSSVTVDHQDSDGGSLHALARRCRRMSNRAVKFAEEEQPISKQSVPPTPQQLPPTSPAESQGPQLPGKPARKPDPVESKTPPPPKMQPVIIHFLRQETAERAFNYLQSRGVKCKYDGEERVKCLSGGEARVAVNEAVAKFQGSPMRMPPRKDPVKVATPTNAARAAFKSTVKVPGHGTLHVEKLNQLTANQQPQFVEINKLLKPFMRNPASGFSQERYDKAGEAPILIGPGGDTLDGRHRLLKKADRGHSHIMARMATAEQIAQCRTRDDGKKHDVRMAHGAQVQARMSRARDEGVKPWTDQYRDNRPPEPQYPRTPLDDKLQGTVDIAVISTAGVAVAAIAIGMLKQFGVQAYTKGKDVLAMLSGKPSDQQALTKVSHLQGVTGIQKKSRSGKRRPKSYQQQAASMSASMSNDFAKLKRHEFSLVSCEETPTQSVTRLVIDFVSPYIADQFSKIAKSYGYDVTKNSKWSLTMSITSLLKAAVHRLIDKYHGDIKSEKTVKVPAPSGPATPEKVGKATKEIQKRTFVKNVKTKPDDAATRSRRKGFAFANSGQQVEVVFHFEDADDHMRHEFISALHGSVRAVRVGKHQVKVGPVDAVTYKRVRRLAEEYGGALDRGPTRMSKDVECIAPLLIAKAIYYTTATLGNLALATQVGQEVAKYFGGKAKVVKSKGNKVLVKANDKQTQKQVDALIRARGGQAQDVTEQAAAFAADKKKPPKKTKGQMQRIKKFRASPQYQQHLAIKRQWYNGDAEYFSHGGVSMGPAEMILEFAVNPMVVGSALLYLQRKGIRAYKTNGDKTIVCKIAEGAQAKVTSIIQGMDRLFDAVVQKIPGVRLKAAPSYGPTETETKVLNKTRGAIRGIEQGVKKVGNAVWYMTPRTKKEAALAAVVTFAAVGTAYAAYQLLKAAGVKVKQAGSALAVMIRGPQDEAKLREVVAKKGGKVTEHEMPKQAASFAFGDDGVSMDGKAVAIGAGVALIVGALAEEALTRIIQWALEHGIRVVKQGAHSAYLWAKGEQAAVAVEQQVKKAGGKVKRKKASASSAYAFAQSETEKANMIAGHKKQIAKLMDAESGARRRGEHDAALGQQKSAASFAQDPSWFQGHAKRVMDMVTSGDYEHVRTFANKKARQRHSHLKWIGPKGGGYDMTHITNLGDDKHWNVKGFTPVPADIVTRRRKSASHKSASISAALTSPITSPVDSAETVIGVAALGSALLFALAPRAARTALLQLAKIGVQAVHEGTGTVKHVLRPENRAAAMKVMQTMKAAGGRLIGKDKLPNVWRGV